MREVPPSPIQIQQITTLSYCTYLKYSIQCCILDFSTVFVLNTKYAAKFWSDRLFQNFNSFYRSAYRVDQYVPNKTCLTTPSSFGQLMSLIRWRKKISTSFDYCLRKADLMSSHAMLMSILLGSHRSSCVTLHFACLNPTDPPTKLNIAQL